jgi:hypothetical protein
MPQATRSLGETPISPAVAQSSHQRDGSGHGSGIRQGPAPRTLFGQAAVTLPGTSGGHRSARHDLVRGGVHLTPKTPYTHLTSLQTVAGMPYFHRRAQNAIQEAV